MTYSQKLRDARWQKVRLKVFERDGWKCQAQKCRSPKNAMLHVHHKKYLPNRDPWEYPLTNLTTYCEKCHDRLHTEPNGGKLEDGHFYAWGELPGLLGFEPHGYLTEAQDGSILCACFRLDYNPDAPDILLAGSATDVQRKASAFARQRTFIPMFVKGQDFGWEYCGKYRVEAATKNLTEIAIHAERAAARTKAIAGVLFLEKEPEG